MDVTPVQNAAGPDAAAIETPATAVADDLNIDANFDTFLSLLTAQLRNQDPLEPVDSTAFVAQLAQFSAVEQQVQTNTALADILGVLGGGDTASLASWLGTNVQAAGPVFFDGSPVALTTTPAPEATDAALIVRNAAGEIIARQPVSGLDAELIWNGLTAAGDPAPNGPYSFTVESSRNGEPLVTQQAVGFSKVEEIRLDGEDPVLVLQGGDSIGLEDVLAVR